MGKRKTQPNENDNGKKYKRPPSAYSLFIKSTWEKDEKKETFTIFTKNCSVIWAKMTDDEKQKYKDEATTLKEKWDGEKAETKKSDSKKKRTPGPYIMFCSEMREKVKKENPELPMPQIAKELGRLWHNLTDGEKAKYQQKSIDEKAKSKQELEMPVEEKELPVVGGVPVVKETPVSDEKVEKQKKKRGKTEKAAKSAISA